MDFSWLTIINIFVFVVVNLDNKYIVTNDIFLVFSESNITIIHTACYIHVVAIGNFGMDMHIDI